MARTPRRTSAPGAVPTALLLGALLLTASGCTEARLEVGDTTRVAEGTAEPVTDPSSDAGAGTDAGTGDATPDDTATAEPLDPRLNAEPTTLGRDATMTAHLPYGWRAIEGSDVAAAGEGALLAGGATVTSVPAEGRSQEEWVQALVAGETDLFADTQGMEEHDPVTTTSGLTLFHLAQAYSENRAQLFGTVVDDTLHLLRFGLPGTDEGVEVATLSAATLSLAAG